MFDIVDFYAKNLRSSLFTGFMTLTGFLFTLHTFLLVTLHRDIYGKEAYQKWMLTTGRKYNPGLNPLRPLRNVSRLLFVMLCCSFISSVMQLSLGLVPHKWAVYTCLGMAVTTILLFALMLWVIRLVISDWLTFVEKEAEKVHAPPTASSESEDE